MAYGTANVDVIQSSTANVPVQFNDGNGTQVGTLCRAWVNFDGTTSPGTIRASFNVTSVTKNATGSYAVNLTNALADTKGSAAGSAYENATGTYTGAQRCVNCSFISSSSLGVFVTYTNGGPADTIFTSVSVFR